MINNCKGLRIENPFRGMLYKKVSNRKLSYLKTLIVQIQSVIIPAIRTPI